MEQALGGRLVAALLGLGASESDILTLCEALETGRQPDLSWLQPKANALVDQEVDEVNVRLYSLMQAHGLLTHFALCLLSRRELTLLCGFGPTRLEELEAYYTAHSLEPRSPEEPFASRAAALYGSLAAAPVTAVLSVVLTKRVCLLLDYKSTRQMLLRADVTAIGQLAEVLAEGRLNDSLPEGIRHKLQQWLNQNGL